MNSPNQSAKNESTARTIGIVAICFAAVAAAWSFIGGACCGWGGWGFAFVGAVLSVVSLAFHRTTVGWWALGLSLFAFLWVFISASLMGSGLESGANQF